MPKARKHTPRPRLIEARERFFETASDAARALGVPIPTYSGHENGSRRMTIDNVVLYAKRFHVAPGWLLFGEMPTPPAYSIRGHVGAGSDIEWSDDAVLAANDVVVSPDAAATRALIVKGDSQYPRFMPGEVILVERDSSVPSNLIGQYAVIQTDDGRMLIKILRRSPRGGDLFALESHNAPLEDGVRVAMAWRYLGTLLRPPELSPIEHVKALPHGRKR